MITAQAEIHGAVSAVKARAQGFWQQKTVEYIPYKYGTPSIAPSQRYFVKEITCLL